jgi:hypothetical protein
MSSNHLDKDLGDDIWFKVRNASERLDRWHHNSVAIPQSATQCLNCKRLRKLI